MTEYGRPHCVISPNSTGYETFFSSCFSRFVGKIGSKIISQFLDTIIWPQFQFCVVDPDENNKASIKLFETCGFKLHKKIQSKNALGNPQTLLLMIKHKPNEKSKKS